LERRREAEEAFAQTRRALRYLRDLIEDSDVPRREIEVKSGFSEGYLAQLLCGNIDLKLSHLVRILDALGTSPEDFFAELYPAWPPRRRTSRHKASLVVTRDVVGIYGYAVESVHELRQRLERCEEALWELKASGVLEELERGEDDGEDG
jgi:transcriptional regulator with XRE-family HTH domain